MNTGNETYSMFAAALGEQEPLETPQDVQQAVVLLSGGVDSSVLLHYVVRELGYRGVHALSFDYGQRHARELECACWQAASVGVIEHRVVDISFMAGLLRAGTSLVKGGHDVPDLADLDDRQLVQPPTYVPNRNMMLLSMSAAYAEAIGIGEVFYGAQAQDEYGYWDCTATFLGRLNGVFELNRVKPVTVRAPFVASSKCETVKVGVRLGVDFAKTWSCYRGGERACGTCPTCVERLNAFAGAGLPDPLPYVERLDQ